MTDTEQTEATEDPKAARRAAQAEWARNKRAKKKKSGGSGRKLAKKPRSAATSARKTRKRASKTGADRKPGEHIMSVHIPVSLLKKLDQRVKMNLNQGKPGASRGAFAVLAIARLV